MYAHKYFKVEDGELYIWEWLQLSGRRMKALMDMECGIVVFKNFVFYWGNIGLYITCFMCMSLYCYFYIHCSMLTTKNLGFVCQHAVDPVYPFTPPLHPPLLTTILFSISVSLFLFGLFLFTCFLFVFILVTLFLFCLTLVFFFLVYLFFLNL